jgi:hypothetical protein
MDYQTIAAKIPLALSLHQLTHDPLCLDAVRVLQEALVDAHTDPHYAPSPMQSVVFGYLERMDTARITLGIDV